MTQTISELRASLMALTNERREAVAAAQAAIQAANRRYDRLAVPLARRLAELEPDTEVTTVPVKASKPKRDKSLAILDQINAYNREHGLPEVTTE